MRHGRIRSGLVAVLLSAAVGAAGAGPTAAQRFPTVCTFAAQVAMNPGVSPVPPYPSGTYGFGGTMVCVGGIGELTPLSSTGSYNGSGGFDGDFVSNTCTGRVGGTRTAAAVVGSADTNCGSGPLAATFTPIEVNVFSRLITRAAVQGSVVLR